jgi:hypothetical protein
LGATGWPILHGFFVKDGLFAPCANRLLSPSSTPCHLQIPRNRKAEHGLASTARLISAQGIALGKIPHRPVKAEARYITFIFNAIIYFPQFSAQKSHVKPKNCLTPLTKQQHPLGMLITLNPLY